MPYSDEKRLILLHVPKTGGNAVRQLFGLGQMHDPDPTVRPSPQHLTCALLRQAIGDAKYDNYYKFTFVRNPWARVLSSYFWRQTLPKPRPVLPLAEFVARIEMVMRSQRFYDHEFDDHFIPQTEFTRDVDDVFRFEALADGIRAVAARTGDRIEAIAQKVPKPHDQYWKYFDETSAATIGELYREEIERFGYRYAD